MNFHFCHISQENCTTENPHFHFFFMRLFFKIPNRQKINISLFFIFNLNSETFQIFCKIRTIVNRERKIQVYDLTCFIKKRERKRKITEFWKGKTLPEVFCYTVFKIKNRIICKRNEENALLPFSDLRVPLLAVILVHSMYYSSTGFSMLLLNIYKLSALMSFCDKSSHLNYIALRNITFFCLLRTIILLASLNALQLL